jgi:hypothetical protein
VEQQFVTVVKVQDRGSKESKKDVRLCTHDINVPLSGGVCRAQCNCRKSDVNLEKIQKNRYLLDNWTIEGLLMARGKSRNKFPFGGKELQPNFVVARSKRFSASLRLARPVRHLAASTQCLFLCAPASRSWIFGTLQNSPALRGALVQGNLAVPFAARRPFRVRPVHLHKYAHWPVRTRNILRTKFRSLARELKAQPGVRRRLVLFIAGRAADLHQTSNAFGKVRGPDGAFVPTKKISIKSIQQAECALEILLTLLQSAASRQTATVIVSVYFRIFCSIFWGI